MNILLQSIPRNQAFNQLCSMQDQTMSYSSPFFTFVLKTNFLIALFSANQASISSRNVSQSQFSINVGFSSARLIQVNCGDVIKLRAAAVTKIHSSFLPELNEVSNLIRDIISLFLRHISFGWLFDWIWQNASSQSINQAKHSNVCLFPIIFRTSVVSWTVLDLSEVFIENYRLCMWQQRFEKSRV